MKYFKPYELVSKTIYQKYGDDSIQFLDNRLLETLDCIREILGVPMVINDWYWNGKNQQRGLRENTCSLCLEKTKKGVLYLSRHTMGRAFDAVSSKMSAPEMRKKIIANAYKLPYPIRLESDMSAPTWLHVDLNMKKDCNKITVFNA